MDGGAVDWHSVVDDLRDGMILASADDRIVHLNPAACALLACDPDDMIGEPLDRIVPERLRRVEGRPLHRFLLERATERDGTQHAPVLRADGVEIVVECTLSESRRPNGSSLLVIQMRRAPEDAGFVVDELGLVQTRQATDRRYRVMFEHAPLGIFHFDESGVITACNDVFVGIIGSSKRLLIGLDMTTLPNRDIVHCVLEAMAGRHADYEGDYRSATAGKVTPVHVHFAPILDQEHAVTGGVGIVADITERKEAERALARAERMASLGTLAAGVAHEINNPLTYVITSIDVARMRLDSLPHTSADVPWREIDQTLANAQEGADRVRLIVRDLKTFVRADDEKPQAVDLEKVVEAAIKLASNEIRHRARLVRSFEPAGAVWGNEARLVQVFVNLLVNAAQAIPEGDVDNHRIDVRIAPEGDAMVRVAVEDTGVGIPPGARERIFEPFWSDRPLGSGTGLGLSIVHGIVSSLGGSIAVDSEPGEGTVFTLRLPRAEPVSEQPAAPPPEQPQADSGRARILVIDDEARLATTVKIGLQPDHDVEICTSGREAVKRLRTDPAFDLVLCDLMLPDTSGPEIYEALRSERPELLERFVFMTGGAFTPRTREFLRKVDNPRLEKPFRLEEIEGLLRARRR